MPSVAEPLGLISNDKILFEKFKSVTEINYNKINSCINHL